MKTLCIVSEESVLGGVRNSGIAELSDSLAYTFSRSYNTNVVTIDGHGFAEQIPETFEWRPGIRKSRMFGINYYLVEPARWYELAGFAVGDTQPDVVHNLGDPALGLTAPRMVYTIDDARMITDLQALSKYQVITTVSKTYAKEILSEPTDLAAYLKAVPFFGITNGILSELFDPSLGHLIPAKFSADSLEGKKICKKALCDAYSIAEDKWIAVMLCRMTEDKGVPDVLNAMPKLIELGGVAIMAGPGGDVNIPGFPHPAQCLQLLAGADFYLSPSRYEPCGLMPMTAARYGCVPIVTEVGGLKDNFTNENAIIVKGSLENALEEAASIYYANDTSKIKACMTSDFSWKSRKEEYERIYEEAL